MVQAFLCCSIAGVKWLVCIITNAEYCKSFHMPNTSKHSSLRLLSAALPRRLVCICARSHVSSNGPFACWCMYISYLRDSVGMMMLQSLPPALWKALCGCLGTHESLRSLSLAGSSIGDANLQVSLAWSLTNGEALPKVHNSKLCALEMLISLQNIKKTKLSEALFDDPLLPCKTLDMWP